MKKIWKLFIIVCLAVLLAICVFPSPALAIQNGTSDGADHPYVVYCLFYVDGEPAWYTSGVLLSSRVVLTAAHGIEGANTAQVSNSSQPLTTGSWVTSDTMYINPDYLFAYDVGIIILDEPIDVDEY